MTATHLDPLRLQELCDDIGQDMLLSLMEDFLEYDYESPLHNLKILSFQERRDILHAIKGVAANIGALSLFLLSRDLMKQTDLTSGDQIHIIEILRKTREEMRKLTKNAPAIDPKTQSRDAYRPAGGIF